MFSNKRRSNRRSGKKRGSITNQGKREPPGSPLDQPTKQFSGSSAQRSSCSSNVPFISNVEQELNPMVAKLLRGETLPIPVISQRKTLAQKQKSNDLDHYRETIQICVANPGRFMPSWALLAIVFGEVKLYEFVRQSAWTPEDLKPFVIPEEED